jgi:hypothetical protein
MEFVKEFLRKQGVSPSTSSGQVDRRREHRGIKKGVRFQVSEGGYIK